MIEDFIKQAINQERIMRSYNKHDRTFLNTPLYWIAIDGTYANHWHSNLHSSNRSGTVQAAALGADIYEPRRGSHVAATGFSSVKSFANDSV